MDAQRNRVYNWERTMGLFREEHTLPEAEVTAYAEGVWERAGMQATLFPTITFGNRGDRSWARSRGIGKPSLLFYQRGQLTKPVILHELAHAIVQQSNTLSAHHSPFFVRVLIDLRVREMGQSFIELLEMAHRMRVRVEGVPFRKIDHELEAAGPKEFTNLTHLGALETLLSNREFWTRKMAVATGVEKAHIGNRLRGINSKLARYGCR